MPWVYEAGDGSSTKLLSTIDLPWLTGVYLPKRPSKPEDLDLSHLGPYDCTVSFSHNGHSATLFWSYINQTPLMIKSPPSSGAWGVVEYVVTQLYQL